MKMTNEQADKFITCCKALLESIRLFKELEKEIEFDPANKEEMILCIPKDRQAEAIPLLDQIEALGD